MFKTFKAAVRAALICLLAATPADSGYMTLTGAGKPAAAGAAYVGPGDIAAAGAWWGLRAYSLATTGNNAVRLVRASDSTQLDIATLSNGNLDTASATTFCNATSCKVVTLYDQTGGGNPLTQATDANRPGFTFSVTGGKPCLQFTKATQQILISSTTFTQAQPITVSSVFNRTNSASTMALYWFGNIFVFFQNPNEIDLNAGSTISGTVTDGAFQAMNAVANNASSLVSLNGSTVASGTAGTSSPSTNQFQLGDDSFAAYLTGYVCEIGWWTTNPSLSANQRAFWGF